MNNLTLAPASKASSLSIVKALTLSTLCTAGLWTTSAMAVEEAKYQVIVSDNKFELREYEAHILARTVVDGDFKEAGSKAFRPLFKYISKDNKAQQKIAMTAPVGQQPISQQASAKQTQWAVSFMMPSSFTLDKTPEPSNKDIKIVQVPKQLLAAVRYSGSWNEKSYQAHLDKLNLWIEDKQYKVTGAPIWARYNSPYALPFMRRNEILIPVAYK